MYKFKYHEYLISILSHDGNYVLFNTKTLKVKKNT